MVRGGWQYPLVSQMQQLYNLVTGVIKLLKKQLIANCYYEGCQHSMIWRLIHHIQVKMLLEFLIEFTDLRPSAVFGVWHLSIWRQGKD